MTPFKFERCRAFRRALSDSPHSHLLETFDNQVLSRLETRNLNYPPPIMSTMGIDWKTKVRDMRKILLVEEQTSKGFVNSPDLDEMLREGAEATHRHKWSWRITQESLKCHDKGWYPFFITLTVDRNLADPETLMKEGKAWQDFTEKLCNKVTKCLGHRPIRKSYVSKTEYMSYAAVVEHGASRQHHHIHALIWLREIPGIWKICPNKYRHLKNYRECWAMKSLWKWGTNSTFTYFRHVGDIWSRLGFVNPLVKGRYLKLSTLHSAGSYLTKYMAKEDKEWSHRMKATHGFGMMKLRDYLRKLDLHQLTALALRPSSYSENLKWSEKIDMPQSLMRQCAKQQILQTLLASPQMYLGMLSQKLAESMQKPYSAMLQSVKDGLRPWRLSSEERFEWLNSILHQETSAFSDFVRKKLSQELGELFPKIHRKPLTAIAGY